MKTDSCLFIMIICVHQFECRSSSAERTKWQWSLESGQRALGSTKSQPNTSDKARPIRFSDDAVEIPGVSTQEDDIVETDDMMGDEISMLNESLAVVMAQRRPSYSPDGSITLLPKPNFAFIPDVGPLRQLFQWGSKTLGSYAVCHACRVGLGYLLLQARTKATVTDLMTKAIFICKFFNIANEAVCSGLVNRFGPTMHFILTNRSGISANMFCGMVLQPFGCAAASYLSDWTIDLQSVALDPRHREVAAPKRSNKIVFNDDDSSFRSERLKILQLTDIHLDLEYRPGANSRCDTELCCRQGDGEGKGSDAAGYYGDYGKCDLPLHSLENALQHISAQHLDLDLIYMTGDLVAHNVWSTTPEDNAAVIHVASELIRKYFPTTRVIPVLGNHDVHPLNLFSPPGIPDQFSTNYIYHLAATEWSSWIPDGSLDTFTLGGFYSVEVSPTFKVIVLNTNVCYTLNFWQVFDHRDPGGQLKWLVTELEVAEGHGVKVHILGHLPPSLDDCLINWSRNYYRIINRFSVTVTSQFFAHTHYDEFQIHYDLNDKTKPISPIWIGASLTPFVGLNPAYKIFEADLITFEVLDHETWIYNLKDANAEPNLPPHWFRLYRATETYQIPDVLPASLNTLVKRMSTDLGTFDNYYRNYHKKINNVSEDHCDKTCQKRLLCRIVTPFYSEQKECMAVQSTVDGVVLPRQLLPIKRLLRRKLR